MRKSMHRAILMLCCFAAACAFCLIACGDTAQPPSPPTVVSVEKTGSDGTKDSYTMTFSDGSTYTFALDGKSDGAYELFAERTGYTGSYDEWLRALLDGTLFGAHDEKCVLTLRVTDENGNAVYGARVDFGGYTYMTAADGTCKIFAERGAQLTVTQTGYKPQTKQISDEDIASGGTLPVDCALVPLTATGQYSVRSQNHMTFSIPAGNTVAVYYWYVDYERSGIRVSVDVLDTDVVSDATELGMNDNIEFVLQKNTTDIGLSKNNSFNVLATLGFDGIWARFAGSASTYDGDISASLIDAGLLDVKRVRKMKQTDGADYTSVEVFIDYSVFDTTYSDAVGNFTISPAARNGAGDATVFRSYVGYNCVWSNASAGVRIKADGSFCENYFDLPDLEREVTETDGYAEGTSLTGDMAQLTSMTAVAKKYGKDVPLFSDRQYFAQANGIPAALDGVSYFYGTLDDPRDFEVTDAGYVVIAAPSEGSSFLPVSAYLENNGFERIASRLPVLGHGSGTTFMDEHTDYYVKYCAVGEKYVLPKWGVVFFGAREQYDKNEWEYVPATVEVLSAASAQKYAPSARQWQGIPGIEAIKRSDGGTRLFACWFTGMDKEPRIGNYALVYYSDDMSTWLPAFAIGFDEDSASRVFDPSLFVDDDNNLWLWWNQTNGLFAEVTSWYVKVTDGESGFSVSEPVMASYGLKMNKPVKLSTGEWLYCAHDFTDVGNTKVYSSTDGGASWKYKGCAKVPNARFANESALVETEREGEKTLIMWTRCTHSYNVAVSYSYDMGTTWTEGKEFELSGPSSRINAKTLPSGNILYVHHYNSENRTNLCAYLSTDGGRTFPHALVLDTRYDVAYPDIATDGENIYVIWDYNRYIEKQILMTTFTEEQLLGINGAAVLECGRIITVSSLTLGADMCEDVHITVTDGSSPLVGATVALSAPYAPDVSAVTDEYGIARFDGIIAEEYVVTVTAIGYEDGCSGLTTAMYIDNTESVLSLTVALDAKQTATISGTVTDIFTGGGIAGATVSAGDVTATTDGDGRYVLENVRSRTEKLTVSADGYTAVQAEIDGTTVDVALVGETYRYLGEIGGATPTSSISTLLWKLYVERNAENLKLAAVGDKNVPSDGGQTELELWLNVGDFGTARTAGTGHIDFLSSAWSRAYNFPSGKQASVLSLADNSANGVKMTISANVLTAEITYSALSKVCGGAAIDENTAIGITFLAGVKASNGWNYCEWQGERTAVPGCGGVIARTNPSAYLLMKGDGRLTKQARAVDTAEELNASVLNSPIGKTHTPLTENMAAFDISGADTQLRLVRTGVYMFDDRKTHRFNGKQLAAVNGMSFLYDGVLENSSVKVTKAGYLLMYATATAAVGGEWTRIIDKTENPGIVTAADVALYALWAEADQTVDVVNDGILMTNAVETELLVFGDSYTDAHVRRFWKDWDKTMAPHGAKTVGISGSRIDTPTGGDPDGWTERVRSGEIKAYNPKKILVNLGVNDIDNGVDGRTSAAALIRLLSMLREQLPDTEIFYTLIVDNIMFRPRAEQYSVHNMRVSAYVDAEGSGKLRVIDFREKLYITLHGIKMLRAEYYADNLHLSAEGYKLWVAEIYRDVFNSENN